MARLCLGPADEGIADLGPQLVDGLPVAHRRGERVVEIGQDPLPQVGQGHAEVGGLAGQGLDAVVVGEWQVELAGLIHGEPDQLVLPAGDHPVLAENERQPISRSAVKRLAVDRAAERDRDQVALGRPAVVHRAQRGLLAAELVDDDRDVVIGHRRDLEAEGIVGVGAEGDRGANRDDRGEPGRDRPRAPSRRRSRPRLVDRDEIGLVDRRVVALADEVLDGLREHRLAPDVALDHVPWCLPGTEARNPGPGREMPVGRLEVAVHLVGRHLDLQAHPRAGLGTRFDGDHGVGVTGGRTSLVVGEGLVVGEARFELARLATPAPKAGASAVPPLARNGFAHGSAGGQTVRGEPTR